MTMDMKILPGLLHSEGPNASEDFDLGLLELWVYPLSSNVSAYDPKSMEHIFKSALGIHVAIDRGLRVSGILFSSGKTLRFPVAVAAILLQKNRHASEGGVVNLEPHLFLHSSD